MISKIIDADTERARSGIQARAEDIRKKFQPLTYDDFNKARKEILNAVKEDIGYVMEIGGEGK